MIAASAKPVVMFRSLSLPPICNSFAVGTLLAGLSSPARRTAVYVVVK